MVNPDRLKSNFFELVKIDSLTYQEKRVVDWLRSRFAELGWQARVDGVGERIGGDTGNLILTLDGQADGLPIAFNCHLDTVQPGERIQPIETAGVIRSAGDTILGADDKAGVAALLEMAHCLAEARTPHGPLQIVLTVAEEKGLLGAKNLDFRAVRGRYVFVFDAASRVCSITTAAPYQNTVNAVFMGRSAHAGVSPEAGINAIQAAAKAIAAMRLGRIDPETTTNIGVISGGRAANIVPDRVEVKGEARSLNEGKLESQTRQMLDDLEAGARAIKAQVRTDVTREYDGFNLTPRDEVVRLAADAIKRVGLRPTYEATGGGSDTNIFNARGLPAVNLGVGYLEPHTTAESISVEQLVKAAEIALAIVGVAAG